MRFAYPIMLDVTNRLVVIVGGGAVAVRKARGVLEAGAIRVRCVAPDIDPAMPAPVERVAEGYDPDHLEGAGVVFAATDLPAVNDAVVRDARARGAIVSRADADDEDAGDFIVPAKWRSGPVTLAVSAGGNPALAVTIRDALAARWDGRWTRMADVTGMLRSGLRTSPRVAPSVRQAIFRDLATEEALQVLASRDVEGLFNWLFQRHPGFSKPPTDG
jgi:siroheme synthase-like protein